MKKLNSSKTRSIKHHKIWVRTLAFVVVTFTAAISLEQITLGATTPVVSVGSATVTQGATFNVPITISTGGNSIDYGDVTVNYPTTRLTCVGIVSSSDFPVPPPGDSCSGGTARILRGRTSNYTSDGVLGYITFTATSAGSASLTINAATEIDSGGIPVSYNKANGTITINAPAAPSAPTTSSGSTTTTTKPSTSTSTTKTPTSTSSTSNTAPSTSTAPAASSSKDTTAPLISEVGFTDATETTVAITWKTNEPANSTVDYGYDANYGQTFSDTGLTTNHRAVLNSPILQKGSVYHFRVKSADASGNVSSSSDAVFQTLGYKITLFIKNKDGSPAAGAKVTYGATTKQTDKDGKVVFDNVAGGKQKFKVESNGEVLGTDIEIGKTDTATVHLSKNREPNPLIIILPAALLALIAGSGFAAWKSGLLSRFTKPASSPAVTGLITGTGFGGTPQKPAKVTPTPNSTASTAPITVASATAPPASNSSTDEKAAPSTEVNEDEKPNNKIIFG